MAVNRSTGQTAMTSGGEIHLMVGWDSLADWPSSGGNCLICRFPAVRLMSAFRELEGK